MKKFIHYSDDIRGFYLNTVELDVPDNFKLPNNATLEPVPTAQAGKKARLTSDKTWEIVDDPDLKTVYDENGKEIKISIYDPIPKGATTTRKPSTRHKFFEGEWLLETEIREKLYKTKYNEINKNVGELIIGGYESNVTGELIKYDSGFHDQTNIKTMADLGIDRKLRATKGGKKQSVPHTNAQLKQLVQSFADRVIEITDKGNTKKDSLTEKYLTMPLDDLKNFDTGIE